jgi:predicted small secreted protein
VTGAKAPARRLREHPASGGAELQKTLFVHNKQQLMKTIRFNRFIIVLFAAALLGLAGAGCKNTAHGAGEDIEKMGDKIQEKTQ